MLCFRNCEKDEINFISKFDDTKINENDNNTLPPTFQFNSFYLLLNDHTVSFFISFHFILDTKYIILVFMAGIIGLVKAEQIGNYRHTFVSKKIELSFRFLFFFRKH